MYTLRNIIILVAAFVLSGMSLWAEKEFEHISEIVPRAAEKIVSFWNQGPRLDIRDGYRPPNYMANHLKWEDFIKESIIPEYNFGVRRWCLHNPFGSPTDGRPMLFDQFIVAKEMGRTNLTNDFTKAWSNFLKQHPGSELIVYLGKMRSIDSMNQNLPYHPELYLQRAFKSVRPILELREFGKIAIAFDASSHVSADHPVYHFMRLIQSLGISVYCEAWPHKDYSHLANFGVTCAERFYQRANLAGGEHDGDQPAVSDRIPAKDFKGEIVILANGHLSSRPELDRDPQLLAEFIREIVEERGFTAFSPVRVLMGDAAHN